MTGSQPAVAVGLMKPTVRIESCVCGGEIVATRDTDDEIAYAVRMHQLSVSHVRWRLGAQQSVKHRCPCGERPIDD